MPDFDRLESVDELLDALPDEDYPLFAETPHGTYTFVVESVEHRVVDEEDRCMLRLREVDTEPTRSREELWSRILECVSYINENDGRLTAESSQHLDYMQDELEKALNEWARAR